MAFPAPIQNALEKYDQKKGFFRRIFSPGGSAPCINELRKFKDTDFEQYKYWILECFVITAIPKKSQASFAVFDAVVQEQFNRTQLKDKIDSVKYGEALLALDKQTFFIPKKIKAITQHSAPNALIKALVMLDQANLLNQSNFDVICSENQENLSSISDTLQILCRKRLLNSKDAKDTIHPLTQLIEIAALVKNLDTHKILDKENFKIVIQYIKNDSENFPNFCQAVNQLAENKILNKKNLALLNKSTQPIPVANAMIILNTKNILTKENRALLQKAKDPTQVAKTFLSLNHHDLLTEENRALIQLSTDPTLVIETILLLNTHHLLQQENLDLFKKSRFVAHTKVAEVLQALAENQLLTVENIVRVNQDINYFFVINAVKELAKNKILNQENFDFVITKKNPLEMAKILSLLTKKEISKDQIRFLRQEDDQGKTHFQTLCILDRAGILNQKTLAILEVYASEFNKDAYYNCFDLAKLLIELKDYNVLDEENVAKIKHIAPEYLWLTTALIQDLKQAKILNDFHFKAVITCPSQHLREIKKKQRNS